SIYYLYLRLLRHCHKTNTRQVDKKTKAAIMVTFVNIKKKKYKGNAISISATFRYQVLLY
ncbi:hypothetical protein, partial [Oenococcus oeni]|uniref:hypothetical protein n=1 Tax=Oenococcus oeni TaxID=1247 RepID=UPI001C5F13B6